MSTEQSNGPFYARPESYYAGYRGPLAYEEAEHAEIPLTGPPPSPQAHEYAPQPLWHSSYKLQPEPRGKITPLQRLVLAIVSVGMIALFSMIVLTSTQNTSTGLIGVGIMCGSIFLVNLAFNRAE